MNGSEDPAFQCTIVRPGGRYPNTYILLDRDRQVYGILYSTGTASSRVVVVQPGKHIYMVYGR